MTTQTCSRCGKNKPSTSFKFDAYRSSYRTVCKCCVNEAARQRYANDVKLQQKIKTRNIAYQAKRKCDQRFVDSDRERRKHYKRIGRICALPGYKPARHDAHVQCWRSYCIEVLMQQRSAELAARSELHDAHVVKWLRKAVRPETRNKRIKRRAVDREQLNDRYIVRLLTNSKRSHPSNIPRTLIDLKRAHLKLKRYLNQAETEDE